MTPISAEIQKLNERGQSIWIDNLSRELLQSGELKTKIELGVSGLTSNPTIFKKAIADTSHYDDFISRYVGEGCDVEEICERLFVMDVGEAADLMRSLYDERRGQDGFASVEVSPLLAHNTEGTVEAGLRIWRRLARPNVMIKVPATEAGIPAIRRLLEEGVNVNVTLIFSVSVYEEVAEAYLSALETRVGKGLPVEHLASVASFFVSRVDSAFEKACDTRGLAKLKNELLGRVGIENSLLAYARFKALFESDRFDRLRRSGAQVQRPLWASTGTKNAALSPVLYVESLALPETVNTLPPATLGEVLKGVTPLEAKQSGALDLLEKHGIPFNELLVGLEREGVALFEESYRELESSVSARMQTLKRS